MVGVIRTRAADLRSRVRQMSNGERALVGGSTMVLVATLFLPWLSVSCAVACVGGSIDGLHGWGLLTLLGVIAVAGLRVARTFPRELRIPSLPLSDPQIMTTAGLVELLGVFLFWVEYHGTFATYLSANAGVTPGFFIALAGALVTAMGGVLLEHEMVRTRTRGRP